MTCVAVGCVSRLMDNLPGISFHSFPSDDSLRKKWIKAMTRDNICPNIRGKVCSLHFKEEDIIRNFPFANKLKKNAVPCVFPQTLEHFMGNNSRVDNSSDDDVVEIDAEGNRIPNNASRFNPVKKCESSSNTKSTFTIVNELIREVHGIKKTIDKHLKQKRIRNCRLKSQIEKLKKSLIEVRDQNTQNNPILANLFNNALQEPEELNMEGTTDDSTLSHDQNNCMGSIESLNEQSYGVRLSNELKKFSSEEVTVLKNKIRTILDVNKPNLET